MDVSFPFFMYITNPEAAPMHFQPVPEMAVRTTFGASFSPPKITSMRPETDSAKNECSARNPPGNRSILFFEGGDTSRILAEKIFLSVDDFAFPDGTSIAKDLPSIEKYFVPETFVLRTSETAGITKNARMKIAAAMQARFLNVVHPGQQDL